MGGLADRLRKRKEAIESGDATGGTRRDNDVKVEERGSIKELSALDKEVLKRQKAADERAKKRKK